MRFSKAKRERKKEDGEEDAPILLMSQSISRLRSGGGPSISSSSHSLPSRSRRTILTTGLGGLRAFLSFWSSNSPAVSLRRSEVQVGAKKHEWAAETNDCLMTVDGRRSKSV